MLERSNILLMRQLVLSMTAQLANFPSNIRPLNDDTQHRSITSIFYILKCAKMIC